LQPYDKKCNHGKEIFAPSYKEYACVVFRIEKFLSKHEISSLETAESNLHPPEPHLLPTVPTSSYQLADMSKG
jgi:hypothetical protein